MTDVRSDQRNTPPAPNPELLDVRAVSRLLTASPRHIYRMSDAGRMPAPVRIGALVRWRASDLRKWMDDGCPAIRSARQS